MKLRRILTGALAALLLFGSASAEYKLTKKSEYVLRVEGMNRYVENPETLRSPYYLQKTVESFNAALDNVRSTKDVKAYVYLVETPGMMPLQDKIDGENEYFNLYLSMSMNVDGIDYLHSYSADELFTYFYSTDKHWNYKGSYQGYQDVARLLGVTDGLLQPSGEVDTGVVFNGTWSKSVKDPISDETFKVYTFDGVPDYKCTVNGKSFKYGHVADYLAGKIGKDTYTNHYGMYYGGDHALCIFESGQAEKPNLLIVGNSFSNAVRTLLTKHFNMIVDVDLRYNENFSLSATVAKYDIDRILFLSDAWMYVCGVTMGL